MFAKKIHLASVFLLLVGFFASLLLAVYPVPKAYADVRAEWLDHSTIKIGDATYFDDKTDGSLDYFYKSDPDTCQDEIEQFNSARTEAQLDRFKPVEFNQGECDNSSPDEKVLLANPDNYNAYFIWLDSGTIATSDHQHTFKLSRDSVFLEEGGDSCKDSVIANPGATSAQLIPRTGGDNTSYDNGYPFKPKFDRRESGCAIYQTVRVAVGREGDANKTAGSGSTAGTGENGDTAQGPELECMKNGGVLAWIVCPVVGALNAASVWMDNTIERELTINVDDYFGNQNQQLYQLWGTFRTLALSLLVIVALIMVISQAMDFGPFDAYTVRKILPRIVAAVILIALSWEIGLFLVQLSNDLGSGVRDLMYSVLKDGSPTINIEVISGFLTSGALLVGGVALGIVGLLSFGLTLALGLFIALLIIIFRRLIIVMCVITAPIAFIAYILPNTQKIWEFWKDTFKGALLIFPLITGFIAGGHVLAQIQSDIKGGSGGTGEAGVINNIVVLILFIGPYFALPLVFRFASGIMSTLGGMVNDRSRGAFDRLKNYRKGKTAQNMQALRSGSRFQERGQFGVGDRRFNPVGRFNRITQGASTGFKGSFGLGTRGRAAMDVETRTAAAEAMKDPRMNQLQFDDDGILAMALSAGSSKRAREALRKVHPDWDDARIDKAVATAASVGINRSNAAAALDMMARNKSFSLPGGTRGMEAIIGATDALAGVTRGADGRVISGNKAMADNLMGSFEFNSRQAGRMDLGMHNYETGSADLDGAWGKASLGQHAQGTASSLKAFAAHHLDRLENGNQVQRRNAAIALMEMQNMLPNATAGNQEIINNTMFRLRDDVGRRMGIDFDAGTPVESQLATIASSGPVGTRAVDMEGRPLSGATIRGMARVYDRESGVPLGQREGGGPTSSAPSNETR